MGRRKKPTFGHEVYRGYSVNCSTSVRDRLIEYLASGNTSGIERHFLFTKYGRLMSSYTFTEHNSISVIKLIHIPKSGVNYLRKFEMGDMTSNIIQNILLKVIDKYSTDEKTTLFFKSFSTILAAYIVSNHGFESIRFNTEPEPRCDCVIYPVDDFTKKSIAAFLQKIAFESKEKIYKSVFEL